MRRTRRSDKGPIYTLPLCKTESFDNSFFNCVVPSSGLLIGSHIMRKHVLIMRKLLQIMIIIIRPVQCLWRAYGKSGREISGESPICDQL